MSTSFRSTLSVPLSAPLTWARPLVLLLLLAAGLTAQITADFDASTKHGINLLKVKFEDLSSGAEATSWLWDFGDGTTSTEQDPKHEYEVTETAVFDVSLTVWAGAESDTLTRNGYVMVELGFDRSNVVLFSEVYEVAMGDLDGDDDRDILTSAGWHENLDGQGTFGPVQEITAPIFVAEITTADVDGDGDNDVLRASGCDFTSGLIAWYENLDGDGTFGPANTLTTDPTCALDVADLDGDGDVDVLGGSRTVHTDEGARWFENLDGAGTFGPAQILGSLDSAGAVRAGDFDGDDDMDVLVAYESDTGIVWFENTDGDGTFVLSQTIDPVSETPEDAHVADVDGDGDDDALVIGQTWLGWYENLDGLGSFGPRRVIDDAFINFGNQLDVADLDGDGDLDVLEASFLSSTVGWYENTNGLGHFGPQQVVTDTAYVGRCVLAEDLDGDGDIDVLAGRSSGLSRHDNLIDTLTWDDLHQGLAGTLGTPVLTGTGLLAGGETVRFDLVDALPNGSAIFVLGLSALNAPFKGGVLVPSPDILVPGLPIDALGRLAFELPWPNGVPAGVFLWFQHWIVDPAAPAGLAASNGLSGQTSD